MKLIDSRADASRGAAKVKIVRAQRARRRMLEISKRVPACPVTIGHPSRARQCVTFLVALALTGCGGNGVLPKVDTPRIRLAGYAAGDEPRAVKIAQDILVQGGTVADAGVALALALTVTLPSRASLGGGGACLIRNGRDPSAGQPLFGGSPGIFGPGRNEDPLLTQSIEFMPRAGKEGGAIGLPALARGLYAIHAKYGKLRWAQIVVGAENMARFGAPVSRAMVHDIASARAEITGPNGKPLAEGDVLPQGELADTLGALRTRGAGDLYTGALATQYLAGTGDEIDAGALRDVTPVWQDLKGVPFGNDVAYFSATPGGALAEKLWRAVNGDVAGTTLVGRLFNRVAGGSAKEDVAKRVTTIADMTGALLPPPTASTDASPTVDGGDAATGFVVVDYRGAAMACSLTMGRLFGAGRLVTGTGILASLPVPGPRSDGLSGAALLVANENVRKVLAAFAAGGDRSGAQVMVQTALNALASPLSLDQAMATPRIYVAGTGPMLAELGLPLGQRQVTETPKLGAVNGLVCPGGLPGDDQQCAVQVDPRGAGLTATAERKR
jgi:gamma-glutamyltranspeptidase/glutathione hydrolase